MKRVAISAGASRRLLKLSKELARRPQDLRIDVAYLEVIDHNIQQLAIFIDGKLEKDIDFTTTLFQSDRKTRAGEEHKPALLDPGCNKLMNLFSVYPDHEIIESVEDKEKGLIKYVVKVNLIHYRTGNIVAQGVGSCTTNEKRYRVRLSWYSDRALLEAGYSQEELDQIAEEALDNFKDGKPKLYRVADMNVLGLDNTILKMSAKRAEMDACFQLPGVAAKFAQDIGVPQDDKKPPVEEKPVPRKQEEKPAPPPSELEGKKIQDIVKQMKGMDPTLTDEAIQKLVEEEKAKAQGLLTTEAALYLIASSWGIAAPEERTGEDPKSEPIGGDRMEYFKGVLEQAGCNSGLVTITDHGEYVEVKPVNFLGDVWKDFMDALREHGAEWIRDGKQSRWEIR